MPLNSWAVCRRAREKKNGVFRTRQNTSKNTEVAYLVWIMAGETAAAVLSKKNGPVAGKETAALSHSA